MDVLGNLNTNAHLNRLRQEHAQISGVAAGPRSIAGNSKNSHKSNASGISKISKASLERFREMKKARETNLTPLSERQIENELEAMPEDFLACNVCGKTLSQDEKVINARFVNEAMINDEDITIFPICIRCNFDNLLINKNMVRNNQLGAIIDDDKPNYFPTSKRLFLDTSLHLNSEEFKQLGTMHIENRTASYYPPENPQPSANVPEDKNDIKNTIFPPKKRRESKQKSTSIADGGRAIMESDKTRA